ncbi:hypothetical protein Scep_021397 [Stephania cephalantha]|uniref:Uncharacterized protein n=1 Tax=Stephania cephalantha TaxID=152367 RepID=A0AAP0F8F2_9MAGN
MNSLMMSESSTRAARNVEATGIDEIETSQPGFEAMFAMMDGSGAAMKGVGIAMTVSGNATVGIKYVVADKLANLNNKKLNERTTRQR